MKTINIALNTRSAFIRDALVYMVNELTRERPGLRVNFSSRSDTLAHEDIIFADLLPGEIHLCNTLIKNRKPGSSVIILHSYDALPEQDCIVNCLRDVIFFAIKSASVAQMRAIIEKALKSAENPPIKLFKDPGLICNHCPHQTLSRSQVAVAHGLIHGFDIRKISAINKVSIKTTTYHKSKIMEKYRLNNNHDFFQFMNLLRERG